MPNHSAGRGPEVTPASPPSQCNATGSFPCPENSGPGRWSTRAFVNSQRGLARHTARRCHGAARPRRGRKSPLSLRGVLPNMTPKQRWGQGGCRAPPVPPHGWFPSQHLGSTSCQLLINEGYKNAFWSERCRPRGSCGTIEQRCLQPKKPRNGLRRRVLAGAMGLLRLERSRLFPGAEL